MPSKLADLPAEAAAEARTIEDLQAQNRELQRKLTLAQKSQPAPTQEQIDAAVAQALAHQERAIIQERHRYEQALTAAQDTLAKIAVLVAGNDLALP